MNGQLNIGGTVSVVDPGSSVHGLRVEAWDDGQCEPVCLGHDLVDRDGRYRIAACPPDDGCPPRVFLRIRDRDNRLIHDGRQASCACPPDGSATLDVELANETLWWHTANPTSWQRPDGPLIDPVVFADINDAATALLQADERPDVLCGLPSLHVFQGILADGWDTLRGDLEAARRLRGTLDLLCDSVGGCGGDSEAGLTAAVAEIFARECEPELECGEPAPEPERRAGCPPACGCGCDDAADPRCPCRPTAVDLDGVSILIMAALHVSCGHEPTARRHITALIDQLCRLDHLATVHTAVTRALCGDQADRRHARELLTMLARDCEGPRCCGDGLGCCATCLDDRLAGCLADAVCAWKTIECFRVTDVSPARACPGDTVELCGTGFGDVPGVVVFRERNRLDYGPVGQVVDWCCDGIRVVVPQGAGCGLTLRLPDRTAKVCGRYLDVRPIGCFDAQFEGTSPEILKFDVAGREDGDCLEPGSPLVVSWTACATDRVQVQIVNDETGAVIDELDPAPERGRWRFDGSGFTETTRVRVRVVADGQCSPPQVERSISLVYQARPDLTVEGLEVTQALQHYRSDDHLTDAADRGPDNSLRLVTGKTAWVRVYLRSGQDPLFDGGQLAGIDGTLTVERRVGGVWSVIDTLTSQNGPVVAQDDFVSYSAERGDIDATLNFVVPASLMTGLLRFTANVASPYECPGNRAEGRCRVDVNLEQRLRAAFITIAYDGPNGDGTANLNLPAPDLATCQNEVSWALKAWPISDADVRIADTFTTSTPLNDPIPNAGGCSPSWQPLLQNVADAADLDAAANPDDWVYYGILPNGVPTLNGGCNWAASGGFAGRPVTYAHEIGHQFGLPHARCGGVGAGNANYPVYEPYDLPVDMEANPISATNWTMASIGEFGLDIDSGAIADPAFAEDFMSYCGPRWIGVFTHEYLEEDTRLDPVTVPTGSGPATARRIVDSEAALVPDRGSTVEPLVVVTGVVNPDGSVEIGRVIRVDGRYRVRGRRDTRTAQLVGADGEILDYDAIQLMTSIGSCGCGSDCCDDDPGRPEPVSFRAYLRNLADGAAIRVVDCDDEMVSERPCPERPPTLSRVRAGINKAGRLRITWTAESHGPDSWTGVRWSDDDGTRWNVLSSNVEGRAVELPLDRIPAGDIRFQVLVSDGFHTVTAESGAIEVPERLPVVAILYPRSPDRVYNDRQIHLRGSASAPGSTTGSMSGEFVWSIEGTEVGRGRDVWVDNPGVGSHRLELRVTSVNGETGTAVEEIVVIGSDPIE